MTKEEFNEWLTERVEAQTKLTIGAVVAMVGLGLLAFAFQGGLLTAIFSLSLGWTLGFLIVLAIFAAMGYFVHMMAPKKHCDSRHKIDLKSKKTKIRVAPTIANTWSFALGSIDSDQSIFERIFGLMMIVPRMFWTARYLHKRVAEVRDIDVPACGRVLRLALQKAERISVNEVEEKYPKMEIVKTMRQVSLIDGVVFLTKDGIGLSLASRFKEDLEESLSKGEETPAEDAPKYDLPVPE